MRLHTITAFLTVAAAAAAVAAVAVQPAADASPVAKTTNPVTKTTKVHFATPLAATRYFAAASNRDDVTALHHVTTPQAFKAADR